MAMWFPVMAFVAMGFEHSVANMFFIPNCHILWCSRYYGAIFYGITLLPATLGNIVGGSVLTGGLYWFAYDRD
jgi:formate transporter